MAAIFFDLGLIVVVAALMALLAHFLRQPPIIAYILAGLLFGPILGFVRPSETLEAFSSIGIALLLFLVGLNLNSRVLRDVGRISIVAGLGQVLFTTVVGYVIVSALGFSFIEALYISVALTFSSTIIVVKILSDKGELDSLYGKIALGILLVQDFISIAVLIVLTGLETATSLPLLLISATIKALVLFIVAYMASRYLLPPALHFIARSQELLFLSGISWMFVFSFLASSLGLSIEIGAFLAGVSMAPLPYTYDLGSRIRPLRDFFIVLFFIILGAQTDVGSLENLLVPTILLSAFVLIGNPLIVMVLMGLLGYRKRTGFLTGLAIAQISEFSLVMVTLGLAVGHISQEIVTLVTAVGIITIAGSVYLMGNGETLYRFLAPYMWVFERAQTRRVEGLLKKRHYSIILVGYGRTGRTILSHLKTRKSSVAVIDFDPGVVRELRAKGYNCMYGDVSDAYILEGLGRLSPKLIVSTVPGFEDSAALVKAFRMNGSTIFVTAGKLEDALELYERGADFVLMPHFLGGEMASRMVSDFAKGKAGDLKTLKKHHMKYLKSKQNRRS